MKDQLPYFAVVGAIAFVYWVFSNARGALTEEDKRKFERVKRVDNR